jgi:hypothetical protein
MPIDDALMHDEEANGYVLICRAEVEGNVEWKPERPA